MLVRSNLRQNSCKGHNTRVELFKFMVVIIKKLNSMTKLGQNVGWSAGQRGALCNDDIQDTPWLFVVFCTMNLYCILFLWFYLTHLMLKIPWINYNILITPDPFFSAFNGHLGVFFQLCKKVLFNIWIQW